VQQARALFALFERVEATMFYFRFNFYQSSHLFLYLAIFLIISNSFSAVAQNADGAVLSGQISDTNKAFVAGATITARDKASGAGYTTQTDSFGNFRFERLPLGSYRVSVTAAGFSTVAEDVLLESNAVQNLQIVLSAGNISEAVTVTATRTELATTETAVPVSVLGREELERQTVNTIGDVFRNLPGTSTVNEGAFQVRPRIRGLDSNRILILVDGERLNNARTSTANSGVEIGLIEVEQIETLEVARGAGSVLYGTDALAGTINIITKNTPSRRTDGFRLGATFNGFYSSNENGRRGNLAVTGSSKFFAFRLAQSLERFDNYFTGDTDGAVLPGGINPDGEVLNSQSHGGNTQATARFFFNNENNLRLNYERRRAANIGSPTLVGFFNAFFPFSNRDKFSARYETLNLTDSLSRLTGSFFVQQQKRNFSNISDIPPFPPAFRSSFQFSETVTDTRTFGFDVQSNWQLGNRNFLIAGASFFRDENNDERFIERRSTNFGVNPPVTTRSEDRSRSVPVANFGSFALFAQNEFELNNRLKFVGGVRVDFFSSKASPTTGFALPPSFTTSQIEDLGLNGLATGLDVSERAVTGDFGAVFKLTDEISLTGRVGRSYRVPNLFERFFTDAGSVGGFVVGNPNLEPETGINVDTGVKVRTFRFAGSFTYFNNTYRNFLSTVPAADRNGRPIVIPPARPGQAPTPVSQTVNIGRARIQGFEGELEIPLRLGDWFLTPSGNISYLRGDNLQVDEPLNTITPLKTVLNLRWQDAAARYYAEWTTRIVNKQERLSSSFLTANLGAEPGFAVSDVRGGYSFRRERYRLSVNAGISNIFNRYYNEQFVFAPARGRSFVLGTSWELF
jgi:hemoglobin/transferrin/lactoferrin receptor protein